MIEAIDRINGFVSGKSQDDIKQDSIFYYAVVKNIEIIGEAANLLSSEFVDNHSKTPWKQVKGMRNYIVHEYFQIDDVVVWGVVTTDIPVLCQQIQAYLKDFK